MFGIPVSYSNALIVSVISATATDVRTSKPHWNAVFLYVHRLGSCEKAHWYADGAGSAINGASSISGPEPAPPEQCRRPIRGAGSASVLEPAPPIPGTCAAHPRNLPHQKSITNRFGPNLQKKDRPKACPFCGETEIRTRDTLLAYTRFPGVPLKPLEHLSNVTP